jgi:hypothetical protein
VTPFLRLPPVDLGSWLWKLTQSLLLTIDASLKLSKL